MNYNLKQRRLELGLTLEEVGNIVGVTKTTVRKWETGDIENMKRDKIVLLANALKTTPSYIMGINDSLDSILSLKNILPIQRQRVPILGNIACGEPILADEGLDGYIDYNSNIKVDFALHCKGDSMINARINDGDIVFIRKQSTVDNGQIACVLIGDEATLKRVYLKKNSVMLVAENPAYQPLVFTGDELDDIRILGKAVAFQSRLI